MVVRKYVAPTLTVHGMVVELTASGSGGPSESVANCVTTRKSNPGQGGGGGIGCSPPGTR